jgi:small-conductance mechanosensitive channel
MGLEPAIRPVPAVELTPAAQRREQTETLQAELADQRNRANEAAKGYDLQITALKRRLSDAQKAVARGDEGQRSALEAVRGQISDLQTQRELARSAVLRGEAPTPAPTLRYTPRFQSIVNNLRGRLDRIGLKDVGLRLESLLDQDAMIEGVYSPENRVIVWLRHSTTATCRMRSLRLACLKLWTMNWSMLCGRWVSSQTRSGHP